MFLASEIMYLISSLATECHGFLFVITANGHSLSLYHEFFFLRRSISYWILYLSVTPPVRLSVHPSIHPTIRPSSCPFYMCPAKDLYRREDLHPLFLLEISPILMGGLYVLDLILLDSSA